MKRLALWIGLLALLAAHHAAGAADTMTISKESFHGWKDTYRLSNSRIEARVVADVGPRILEFRPHGGESVLYLRENELGGSGEPKWVFRGGWRLWVAPERTETTYSLDNSPCEATIVDQSTLRVTGPPQTDAGIQKQVEIQIDAAQPHLRITSRIKNISERPLTYAAWSLPALRPGGRAFVPSDVGPLTAFDAIRKLILWSYTEIADPRYRWGDRLIEIDHTQVRAPAAPDAPRRDDESKIGVDSAQGWEAYLLGSMLFLKRFPHHENGQYPDGGATIEVYSSHEFLELEHLGPLTALRPGEEIVFSEDWWLFTGVTIGTGEERARRDLEHYIERTNKDR